MQKRHPDNLCYLVLSKFLRLQVVPRCNVSVQEPEYMATVRGSRVEISGLGGNSHPGGTCNCHLRTLEEQDCVIIQVMEINGNNYNV